MLLRAAIATAMVMGIPTSLHFVVRAADSIDRAVTASVSSAASDALNSAAGALGYVRPAPPMEQHTLEDLAEKEALLVGINPALVRAVMHVESRAKKFAESPKGAIGPMQVMPFNARRCDLEHYSLLWTPETNVRCGVQILSEELKAQKGNVLNALEAYNGGPGCIGKCRESVNYSRAVLARLAQDIR